MSGSSRQLPGEDELSAIREGVRAVVSRFGDDYWLARDEDGAFPREFHRAMADAGWLGITMPEDYGGAGLGVTEAAVMMHEVATHGGAMAAASTVHINLFGPHPIVVKGTPDQKARWVPRLISGQDQCVVAWMPSRWSRLAGIVQSFSDPSHAEQAQRRAPTPHSEDEVQGEELGAV